MYAYLQASRGVAAGLVVLFHTATTLSKDKYFGESASMCEGLFWFGGQAGVAFFFVLSGFIIAHAHQKDVDHPDRLIKYLKKRFVRIYPTFWCILALSTLALYFSPSFDQLPKSIFDWISVAFLLPHEDPSIIAVAWTLHFEVIFYLVFAIAIYDHRFLCFPICGYLVHSVWRLSHPTESFLLNFLSSHFMWLFAMGVMVALIIGRDFRLTLAKPIFVLSTFAFLIICGYIDLIHDGHRVGFNLLLGSASSGLIYALVKLESCVEAIRIPKWAYSLGNASYVLYLLHMPLVSVMAKVSAIALPKTSTGALFALLATTVVCCVSSIIYYEIVEKRVLAFSTLAIGLPVRRVGQQLEKV